MGGEVGAILGLVAALMYSWEVLVLINFEVYSRDMYHIHIFLGGHYTSKECQHEFDCLLLKIGYHK